MTLSWWRAYWTVNQNLPTVPVNVCLRSVNTFPTDKTPGFLMTADRWFHIMSLRLSVKIPLVWSFRLGNICLIGSRSLTLIEVADLTLLVELRFICTWNLRFKDGTKEILRQKVLQVYKLQVWLPVNDNWRYYLQLQTCFVMRPAVGGLSE